MSTTTTTGLDRLSLGRRLGIGMRIGLHPHCGEFVDVILGALADTAASGAADGLDIVTGDVSTYAAAVADPAEQRLAGYAVALVAAAHRRADSGHVVAQLLLSRGCPGEVGCAVPPGPLPTAAPVDLAPTGIPAVGQWSLYPLVDPGRGEAAGATSPLAVIEAAIDRAGRRGVAVEPAHFATMLRGDLADVLAVAVDGWSGAGSLVPHVTSHVTVSVGSPSAVVDEPGAVVVDSPSAVADEPGTADGTEVGR